MNNKLRQKIPRLKSKKGLSLVELLVGVTIIAMVMASAAGAIVTGYKTTIDNAERNKATADSASLNEIILKGIKNCKFSTKDDADEYFFGVSMGSAKDPNTNPDDSIFQTAKELFSNVQYYSSSDFPSYNYDVQYQLDTNASQEMQDSGSSTETIKGIKIRTAVQTPDGFAEIVSFIPYRDQT